VGLEARKLPRLFAPIYNWKQNPGVHAPPPSRPYKKQHPSTGKTDTNTGTQQQTTGRAEQTPASGAETKTATLIKPTAPPSRLNTAL
jgi:hypothetical protein